MNQRHTDKLSNMFKSKYERYYRPVWNVTTVNPVDNYLYKPVASTDVSFSIKCEHSSTFEPAENDEAEFSDTCGNYAATHKLKIYYIDPRYSQDLPAIEKLLNKYYFVFEECYQTIAIYLFAPVYTIEYLHHLPLKQHMYECKYLPSQFFALTDVITEKDLSAPALSRGFSGLYSRSNFTIGIVDTALSHSLTIDLYIESDFSQFCKCPSCKRFNYLTKSNELLWFLQSYQFVINNNNNNYNQKAFQRFVRITRFTKKPRAILFM